VGFLRRRWDVVRKLAPPVMPTLLARALVDGAQSAYIFNEASGNAIDYSGLGNHLQVAASVVRPVGAVNLPDVSAYDISPAFGGATRPNGHADGNRPSWTGSQAFSFEIICRRTPPAPAAQRFIYHAEYSGAVTALDVTIENDGTLRSGIQVAGELFHSQTIATSPEAVVYAHYVMRWDGTTHDAWRNGVQVFATAVGAGGGLDDGTPFRHAVGGVFGFGSLNGDCDVDFLAIYPSTFLTGIQIADHYALSGA
jgi:hypothetical protein